MQKNASQPYLYCRSAVIFETYSIIHPRAKLRPRIINQTTCGATETNATNLACGKRDFRIHHFSWLNRVKGHRNQDFGCLHTEFVKVKRTPSAHSSVKATSQNRALH